MPDAPTILPDDENAVLITAEVAAALRTSDWKVCRWHRQGLLPSCTPQKRPLCFRVKEIVAFMERQIAADAARAVPDATPAKKEVADAVAV